MKPDQVILRRTWTQRTKDANRRYSDWHLVDVINHESNTAGTLVTLCGGRLPSERRERPGDARTHSRVCPTCVQALAEAQRRPVF